MKILNRAGIEVVFPEEQTCCGAPARYSGAYEVAANNAIDNIKALLGKDVKYVVSACPTCTVALQARIHRDLREPGQTEWLARARELCGKDDGFLDPGQEAGGRGPADPEGGQAARQGHLS